MSDDYSQQGAFGNQGVPPHGGASDPTTPIPPPPPAQTPGGSADGPLMPTNDNVTFFQALFDYSFTHFVTPKLIKIVYILMTALLALVWLTYVVLGLSASIGVGILALIGGGLFFLIYLALARMSLEFFLALVRMSEDIHKRLPAAP